MPPFTLPATWHLGIWVGWAAPHRLFRHTTLLPRTGTSPPHQHTAPHTPLRPYAPPRPAAKPALPAAHLLLACGGGSRFSSALCLFFCAAPRAQHLNFPATCRAIPAPLRFLPRLRAAGTPRTLRALHTLRRARLYGVLWLGSLPLPLPHALHPAFSTLLPFKDTSQTAMGVTVGQFTCLHSLACPHYHAGMDCRWYTLLPTL